MKFLGCFICSIMSLANSDSFIISLFSIWSPFISFIVWLLWLGHPITFWKKSGKSGHPYLISCFRGTVFSFTSLTMILAIHWSYIAFLMVSYIPSLPTYFYYKWKLNFVKSFLCIYWDEQMGFTLYFVIVVCNIDFRIFSYPCICGINLTWSWRTILLVYCWIQFADILLRIFASMFIYDIDLQVFFFFFFFWMCLVLESRWCWPSRMSSEHSFLSVFWSSLRSTSMMVAS